MLDDLVFFKENCDSESIRSDYDSENPLLFFFC